MNPISVERVVKSTLLDLDIANEKIIDTARLHSDLGLDSSEIVEIALALKNAFDFDVTTLFKTSSADFTLGELYKLVEDNLKVPN
jgi:acyl carrier protein